MKDRVLEIMNVMPAWRNLVDATDLKCALSSDVEIVVFPVALILLMITID